MLVKVLALFGCLGLTVLFSGCADFEYSEPGVYGYYEPHYYYDRYPHYFHGTQPYHYVHAFRPAAHPVEHADVDHGGHDEHR